MIKRKKRALWWGEGCRMPQLAQCLAGTAGTASERLNVRLRLADFRVRIFQRCAHREGPKRKTSKRERVRAGTLGCVSRQGRTALHFTPGSRECAGCEV